MLRRISDFLTAPSPKITSLEEARRARLVATSILVVGVIITFAAFNVEPFESPIYFGALAVFAVSYSIIRRGGVRFGSVLFVGILWGVNLFGAFARVGLGGGITFTASFDAAASVDSKWFAMTLLLSALLLPARLTALFTFAVLGTIVALRVALPTAPGHDDLLPFLVTAAVVGIVAASLRDRDHRLVEEQREVSDSLLRNILPGQVADELRSTQKVAAREYPLATVLFADLVGFTEVAAEQAPAKVVGLLNDVFSRFDDLTEELGLEKIKTIGDAYMAVSGLPAPRPHAPPAAARLALAMHEHVGSLGPVGGRQISMRIGLHTGRVVAGVIGSRKFSYDIWGHTVNVASRIESSGQPGEIHVSQQTYEYLVGDFELDALAPVELKGLGPLKTYRLGSAVGAT